MSAATSPRTGPAALPRDPRALGTRLAGAPLVVLLDVDGTLAPIAPRPEEAAVPAATVAALGALVARGGTHVGLVSGRAAADARRLVGVSGVWVVGNHGLEMAEPGGATVLDARLDGWREALAGARDAASGLAAGVTGAFVEDKGATLSVHYRLVDATHVARFVAGVEEAGAARGLRVTHGRKVVELRPPLAVDKGTAVLALAARLGARAGAASVVFAGDDVTDEDAMRALRGWHPDAVTIQVASGAAEEPPRETAAEWVVESPESLGRWIAALAELPA